ncbi:hypothetical protein [Umezawaea tangerina]|uniref:Uncharacterized protein n=1 Tax=Umezawaea tangerina TaxID=84725 RepID=A0A2T0SPP8_9PSEU|nr:hypothetical protein [Umezawaea tangerina]PRY35333.1 hypothetical protein CLV43_114251 [Umezawaea tangerina]
MGYIANTTIDLEFDPEQFPGLEVVAEDGSVTEYFMVHELYYRKFPDHATARQDMQELHDLLVPKLVSWTLERREADGSIRPLPLDRATFGCLAKKLQSAVIEAWLDAVQGVSRPLDKRSPSGEQSAVASIPTETLSDNQPS